VPSRSLDEDGGYVGTLCIMGEPERNGMWRAITQLVERLPSGLLYGASPAGG
jgi:hypothetical protein